MGNGQSVTSNYVVQQNVGHQVDRFDNISNFRKAADAGNFGSVRRGIDTRTQQPRAIKHIEKANAAIKENVLREVEILQAVCSSGQQANVVQFFEYFEEWGHFDLVFEFCSGGTLADAINSKSLSDRDSAGFCHQMLSALAFIKSRGVLHRDVKPANVLLKDQGTCKLADFGSSCFLNAGEDLFNRGGSPAFWGPEVDILPRGEGYSFPLDVWATGITLYMMLFQGVHPFVIDGHIDQKQLQRADFDAGMMWLWDAKKVAFISWLLMPCPRQRVLPENACNHVWLSSFGFGSGNFSQDIPRKMLPDSYGRWG